MNKAREGRRDDIGERGRERGGERGDMREERGDMRNVGTEGENTYWKRGNERGKGDL